MYIKKTEGEIKLAAGSNEDDKVKKLKLDEEIRGYKKMQGDILFNLQEILKMQKDYSTALFYCK